ncbi:MAG: helix-turn-helix domain-containing protein [Clostridia bacterium]|nr:helix-turn-helix domain-containing protein [Clostridia bacterium]
MALRLKKLRETKKINKTKFAETMEVNYRTVTNWEKANGIVPSLNTMTRIAKELEVSTYKIYECFMIDPDLKEGDDSFVFNKHNFGSGTGDYMDADYIFNWMNTLKLYGKGVLTVGTQSFSFSHAYYSEKQPLKSLDSLSDECLRYAFAPFDSVLLTDRFQNIYPLRMSDIKEGRIASASFGNIVIELIPTNLMLNVISPNSNEHIIITFFDYKDTSSVSNETFENQFRTGNSQSVFSFYIKQIRKQNKLTQEEFAKRLNETYPSMKKIDNKTINKLEKGKILPTPNQIKMICCTFIVPVENLLNSYDHGIVATDMINNYEYAFDVGINYLFNRVKDIQSFEDFIISYKIVANTLNYTINHKLCYVEFGPSHQALHISNIEIKDDTLILTTYNNRKLVIHMNDISYIEKCHYANNYFYEFAGTIIIPRFRSLYFRITFSKYLQ